MAKQKVEYDYGEHTCPNCEIVSEFDSCAFYGLCPRCWFELKQEQRMILRGEEPPIQPPPPVREKIIIRSEFDSRIWRICVIASCIGTIINAFSIWLLNHYR